MPIQKELSSGTAVIAVKICYNLDMPYKDLQKRKEYIKQYSQNEKRKERTKEYYQKNKDKFSEYNKKWNLRNKGKQKEYRQKNRLTVLNYYSFGKNECACCGEKTIQFLVIDHINNDGAKHRKELAGGTNRGGNVYPWLIKNNFPEGFQVLCWNCNSAKSFYGMCPHKL